jgi:hypothetical protein
VKSLCDNCERACLMGGLLGTDGSVPFSAMSKSKRGVLQQPREGPSLRKTAVASPLGKGFLTARSAGIPGSIAPISAVRFLALRALSRIRQDATLEDVAGRR